MARPMRMYDTRRWRKARIHFLAIYPLCVLCQRSGRVTPATVVDHITPHDGNPALFWDPTNWQALCKPCHDSAKKIQEKRGALPGCDANGLPLDPNHRWRKS